MATKKLGKGQCPHLDDHVRWIIIKRLQEYFEPRSDVYACWLEGADGLGKVDAYSDIDLWLDVEDGQEIPVLEGCLTVLEEFGPLDLVERHDHPHPKIFQYNAHISGTPEFLIVDICVQSHSRGSEGCTFVEGDPAELPDILFDKADVVKMIPEPPLNQEEIKSVFRQCQETLAQQSRVRKYILRRKYLEAKAYYEKYVYEPLVTMYRLLYTPRHHEYGPVHISDHLPDEVVGNLEVLHRFTGLEDIERNLNMANELAARVTAQLQHRYSWLRR